MRNKRQIGTFHVFYRISDNGHINDMNKLYATKMNCLKNAVNTFCCHNCVFHLFIDKVTNETDKQIHKLCDNIDNIVIEYLNCGGNSKSFIKILELACNLPDNDFIYFLEDDYIHRSLAYDALKDAAEWNYTDYITLYDNPDKYDNSFQCIINPLIKQFGEYTLLFKTSVCHWKITNSTTMTFGTYADIIKRDKDIILKYCQGSCPGDFQMYIELANSGKYISCSIPGLSTHTIEEAMTPFVDWEKEINITNSYYD